jgi:hypothetical protein
VSFKAMSMGENMAYVDFEWIDLRKKLLKQGKWKSCKSLKDKQLHTARTKSFWKHKIYTFIKLYLRQFYNFK